MLPRSIATALILLLLFSSSQQPLFAQQNSGVHSPNRNPAGTIDWLTGSVQITAPASASTAATTRNAKTGDTLYEGDAMSTAAKSEAHLNMTDGGFMALRPDTRLLVSKYQANGDTSDTSVVQLLQGALRSVTGWIGKTSPKNYSIRTATATIGVRGTEHETAVVTSGDASEQGTYDRVYEGATTLSTPEGSVDVERDKAGFVPSVASASDGPRFRPRLLSRVPQRVFVRGQRDAHFVGLHARLGARMLQRREQRREMLRSMGERTGAERRHQNAQQRMNPKTQAQHEASPSSESGSPPTASNDAPARGPRELREQRAAERERKQALRQQQNAPSNTGN